MDCGRILGFSAQLCVRLWQIDEHRRSECAMVTRNHRHFKSAQRAPQIKSMIMSSPFIFESTNACMFNSDGDLRVMCGEIKFMKQSSFRNIYFPSASTSTRAGSTALHLFGLAAHTPYTIWNALSLPQPLPSPSPADATDSNSVYGRAVLHLQSAIVQFKSNAPSFIDTLTLDEATLTLGGDLTVDARNNSIAFTLSVMRCHPCFFCSDAADS